MFSLREYKPEDAAGVERCFIELQEHERSLEPLRAEGWRVAAPYLAHMFELCEVKCGRFFVAEAGGQVVGFVCVFARATGGELVNVQTEFAYVSDLVVLPEFRGRGIGRALLARAEEFAVEQGATLIQLSVLAKNSGPRRLYEQFGFEDFEMKMLKRLAPG